jgi:predicted 3-demethylubiquinone-9 3-methyltransferase (glyoxalase superfamily)
MSSISPFLWFDAEAEEAAELYVSVFPNSRILDVQRIGEGAPGPGGAVVSVSLELDGVVIQALNGNPSPGFTESMSLFVSVETQEEIDGLWDGLTANGGEPGRCGWLKDRFGVSWQIIPTALGSLLGDPDPARANAAMQAMLTMDKLDIAALRAASDAA